MNYLDSECECGHTRKTHILNNSEPPDDDPMPMSMCNNYGGSGYVKQGISRDLDWEICPCDRFKETLDSLITRTREREMRRNASE